MGYYIDKGTFLPAAQPVSFDLAKANSNIETAEADPLLKLKLDAAHIEAENYLGRLIIQRNIVLGFDAWSEINELPIGPLTISGISYKDTAGDTVVLDPGNYKINNTVNDMVQEVIFTLDDLPELYDARYPITITGIAGLKETPAPIKEGILLIFSANELYREDMPLKMNRSSRARLRPYRLR